MIVASSHSGSCQESGTVTLSPNCPDRLVSPKTSDFCPALRYCTSGFRHPLPKHVPGLPSFQFLASFSGIGRHWRPTMLSLNCTCRQATDELFLEHSEQHNDRQRHDHAGCHHIRPTILELTNVCQHETGWDQAHMGTARKGKGKEQPVPGAEESKKAHRDNARNDEGQGGGREGCQSARAIQTSRIL